MVSITYSQPQVSAALSRASSVRLYCLRSPLEDLEDPATDPVELGTGIKSTSTTLPLAGGSNSSVDHSYRRHDIYFFEDGNITFVVHGTLYCVHRYFFARDSVYFSTKFTQLGVRGHKPLRTIVSLGDVENQDFEAFLSVIYPKDFDECDLSYEQWRSVLRLSSRWGFSSLRRLALKSIEPPNAFEQLVIARSCGVDNWVFPALSALCERRLPLSLEEARQMDIEDVVLIATVREEILSNGLPIDTAGIPRYVERILAHAASEDVSPSNSKNDSVINESPKEVLAPWTDIARPRMLAHVANDVSLAENESLKEALTRTGSNTEAASYDRTKEVVVANPPEKADGRGLPSAGTNTETKEEAEGPGEKIDPTYNQPQTQKDTSDDCPGEGLCQTTNPKHKKVKKVKKERKAEVKKVEKEKRSKKVSSKTTDLGRDILSREDLELSEDTFRPVLCEVRYGTHYIPPPPVT